MSAPKPVSPDFAAMARDYAERCGFKMKNPGYRMVHEDDLTKAFIAFAKDIRALASDPVAGDHQIHQGSGIASGQPFPVPSDDGASAREMDKDRIPGPAVLGLAAQEVERLRAIETAAQNYVRCQEDPRLSAYIKENGLTSQASPWSELRAALSAPRPAHKEGPTE